MSALDAAIAGPWGPYVTIALMALAAFACRAGGYLLMSHVRVTPAIERALQALPGCIVVAIVVPAAMRAGPPALLGVGVAVALMAVMGSEIAALAVGLATVAALRAGGF